MQCANTSSQCLYTINERHEDLSYLNQVRTDDDNGIDHLSPKKTPLNKVQGVGQLTQTNTKQTLTFETEVARIAVAVYDRCPFKEGTSRQRSGKGAIRKRFPLQKPRWEKTKLTIRYYTMKHIVSRISSYFPNRWPLSYLDVNMLKFFKCFIATVMDKNKCLFAYTDVKEAVFKFLSFSFLMFTSLF